MDSEILSLLALISTFAFYGANLSCTQAFLHKGSVGNATALPFIATVVNCLLWTRYGVLLANRTIIIVNFIGVLAAMYSLFLYYQFTDKKSRVERLAWISMAFMFSVLLYTRFGDTSSVVRRLSLIADFVTMCMFASPLVVLGHVIRTKDSSAMSFPLSISSFLMCLCWTLYGFAIDNVAIIVPNFVGLALSIIQVAMLWIYRKVPMDPNDLLLRPVKLSL